MGLTLDKVDCFPNRKKPRVAWVGLQPNDDLATLQKAITPLAGPVEEPSKSPKKEAAKAEKKEGETEGDADAAKEEAKEEKEEKADKDEKYQPHITIGRV